MGWSYDGVFSLYYIIMQLRCPVFLEIVATCTIKMEADNKTAESVLLLYAQLLIKNV